MTKDTVEAWVRQLLASHGVQTTVWNNGEIGAFNVPAKWAGIISDMSTALVIVGDGKPLPKLLPRGKGKTVRR
jgi:hypothetical protein